jgi:nitrous oxide reductase accessory protein NosL
MFVAKYPDWIAAIRFADGSVVYFDGAKDMFKYYYHLNKYDPDKSLSDIEAVTVTEYYRLETIDARRAFFVIGSDVYGPMGRELIPFESRADAEVFLRDHNGTRIVEFDRITPALVEKLD